MKKKKKKGLRFMIQTNPNSEPTYLGRFRAGS